MKEKILKILIQNQDKYISGQEIADKLTISRNAIWKNINCLKENGFNIKSGKNKGYMIELDERIVNEYTITKYLSTSLIGSSIKHFKEIASTNDYLKLKNDKINGELVVADYQTAGRGRRNRKFHSPKNNGIYISFNFKPNLLVKDLVFLTIISGIATVKAIREVCGFMAEIKWVNDIFYQGKKLGGILTEATIEAETQIVENVIIGIGINIENIKNFPEEFKDICSACEKIANIKINKNRLIAEILNHFEKIFNDFILKNNHPDLIEIYKKFSNVLNREITVKENNSSYTAKAIDILADGRLLVIDQEGNQKKLLSADVSILPKGENYGQK